MARSAAAKKVAKAASAGGSRRGFRPRRDLLFPAAMLLVVILGVVLILVARNERSTNAPAGPPRLDDHWHSLYAIYDCDDFVLDLYPNDVDDFSGIHTHGDGLIHIHPFHTGVTGQFATVGAFMGEIEFELNDSRFELPDGTILDESGEGCASPDPDSEDPDISEPGAELRIMRWETLQAEKALAFTEDLRDVRFLGDGQIFVFVYVHPSVENADVPRPDDAFLRSYLNLPPEDQPLTDGSTEEGPVLDDGGESEPVEGDLPVTSEPTETVEPGTDENSMGGEPAAVTP
ncbi:hypothetical protein [Candidatus Poriferisodalis sp.]|uniref:hypothetical protein n=1 Tax=Candidatus Poriferisodalis sp. TaxID=3101277 RepID=UPI003B52E65B